MIVDQAKVSSPKRIRKNSLDTWYVSLVQSMLSHAKSGEASIGIMSSLQGEGTSTIAVNIALTAAALNAGPVLLVDANDLNPSLHKLFGMKARLGLQNALAGKHSPLECVTSTQIDSLSLVLHGQLDSSETAIYSSSSINEIVGEWRDAFRLVVVDLPPASRVSNGAFMATHLDSVLLVAQANRADRQRVAQTSAHLRKMGVPLTGAIYNMVDEAGLGVSG